MKLLHRLADVWNGRGCNLEAVCPHICDEPFTWTSSTNIYRSPPSVEVQHVAALLLHTPSITPSMGFNAIM